MTAADPLVSVIVLTHNRLRLMRDAVQTLCAQDYPGEALEIIVVNDGSTDGTRAWLEAEAGRNPRLRAVHQPALGIPAARNAGIRAARGDFIAIVADDYLLAPDYVSTFVRFFQAHPEASIMRFGIVPADRWPGSLLSHFYYEVSFRKRLQPRQWPASASRREKLRFHFRKLPAEPDTITTDHRLEAAGAAAFRRAVFDRVGRFDENLKRAEDTDLSVRLRNLGIPIHYNPHHKIRHRYGRWGGDTIAKNYESGIYAARLQAKLAATSETPDAAPEGLAHRALSLIGRTRQAANPLTALLLFPGILLLECVWLVGYWRGKRTQPPTSKSR